MPGWYIHMEEAKKTVERLRAGDVLSSFPGGVSEAQKLGELGYKWRNYLAAGAIGPDIFFLLPDFRDKEGNVLLKMIDWVRNVYEILDKLFLSKWEKWAQPVIDGVGDVLDQMSGGVLKEIGQGIQEITSAWHNALLDLVSILWDWFGIFANGGGVTGGYADSAFFWSDMFHYRKTYAFAKKLFENANSEQQKAFALGWISHCATDVVGHSFVNSKCGGPFRLHWQRHHLVENHMDAYVYDSQHKGIEPYGELDTSALHFRLAFRKRNDQPYGGAEDAPAYDYFSGFPPYDAANTSSANFKRNKLWDLDTGDLPDDLSSLLINTMKDVYNDKEPKILTDYDAEFRDNNSGRPSTKTLQNTYWVLYHYVKFSTTHGYSPSKPSPPEVLNDHSLPSLPGSDAGVSDDPTRGDDPDETDDDINILDIILAIFGWIIYLEELAAWLITLPEAVLADILTHDAREILYENYVVPLWSFYMATRVPLVMTGFLKPKHEEILQGLVRLGVSSIGPLQDVASALSSADGTASTSANFDEKSGRSKQTDAYGADPAYPRSIIEDDPTIIAKILHYLKPDLFCGLPKQPSEFLRPWIYPERNNANKRNGWEPSRTHPGPYLQGQDAQALLNSDPGDDSARSQFEGAASPIDTEAACDAHLPSGRHMGDPVDYGLYLIGKFTNNENVPDFNLDADRGYGYLCWDWNRDQTKSHIPNVTGGSSDIKYEYNEPCTVPEGYCEDPPNSRHYDPTFYLNIHYENINPGCNFIKVTPYDIDKAGIKPEGET
jgi:hypothetical protein